MIDRDLMIGALTTDGMVSAMLTKSEAERLSDEELYEKFLELEQLEKGGVAYDQQKETHGKVATFVWIISGVYLFVSSEDVSLLSWQAVVFIVVGMFLAALIFGGLGYGIQRGIGKILAATISDPPTNGMASAIGVLGLAITLLEVVLTFYVAGFVFALFI